MSRKAKTSIYNQFDKPAAIIPALYMILANKKAKMTKFVFNKKPMLLTHLQLLPLYNNFYN